MQVTAVLTMQDPILKPGLNDEEISLIEQGLRR